MKITIAGDYCREHGTRLWHMIGFADQEETFTYCGVQILPEDEENYDFMHAEVGQELDGEICATCIANEIKERQAQTDIPNQQGGTTLILPGTTLVPTTSERETGWCSVRRSCGHYTEFADFRGTKEVLDSLHRSPCQTCENEKKADIIGNCIRCGNKLHRGETCGCQDG
jgi:hypothetical protein